MRETLPATMAFLVTLGLSAQDAGPSPTRSDPEEFAQGLDGLRRQVDEGRWEQARAGLQDLLGRHERRLYVYPAALEIQELLRRCELALRYPEPRPEDVVSGDLVYYNEKSGRLKITYGPGQLDDFRVLEAQGTRPRMLQHRCRFEGSYAVEVHGGAYPSPGLLLWVGAEADQRYEVDFGDPSKAPRPSALPTFAQVRGGRVQETEQADRHALRPGAAFEARVAVTSRELRVSLDRRTLFRSRAEADTAGYVVIADVPFDRILLEGMVEQSWMQGLCDAHRQRQLGEFASSVPASEYVPAWLLRAPPAHLTHAVDTTGADWEPSPLIEQTVRGFGQRGDTAKGLAFIEALPGSNLREGHRWYLRALLREASGSADDALDMLATARTGVPGFRPAWERSLLLLSRARRRDETAELWVAMGLQHPDEATVGQAVDWLLGHRRPEQARQLLDGLVAVRHGLDLAAKRQLLMMAEQGPRWSERFAYETDHYRVITDIDQATARKVALTMERALDRYAKDLLPLPPEDPAPFRVFLFRGQDGYHAYLDQLQRTLPFHTAGLFVGTLQQLVVWNLPSEEDMVRTSRHEGLHQYLDRVLPDAPRWLHEGLAGYYEVATDRGGAWRTGQLNEAKFRGLVGRPALPVRRFLRLPDDDFLADPDLSYAESWALVHYLLHRDRTTQARFRRILEELQQPQSSDQALQRAFADADWSALESDFAEYLVALRQELREQR